MNPIVKRRLEEVKKFLGNRLKSVTIEPYEDPEIPNYRKIFIDLTVSGEDLDELQKLWDKVIDIFYEDMPHNLANKYVISVEPG